MSASMSTTTGRNRKFKIDEALEAATLIFWEFGYEGASIAALTKAMGINAPSLYNTFGSKENLLFAAIDHYNQTHGAFFARALAEESEGLTMLQRILHQAADIYPAVHLPGGCLVISATVNLNPENRHIGERLSAMRNDNIIAMASRDDISEDMARFVGVVLQGMSQQARDGATAEQLHRIADISIRALERMV